MLTLYPHTADPPASAVWIDVVAPDDDDRAKAEALAGTGLPTREALSEIETSSRLRVRDGTLFMSMPAHAPQIGGKPVGAPIGFVLTCERLVTVRFGAYDGFDAAARRFERGQGAPATGLEAFIALTEEIVDTMADGLEHLAETLAELSSAAFNADDTRGRQAIRSSRLLRIQLRQVGRIGDRLSGLRDSLLGLGRVAAFAAKNTQDWSTPAEKTRMTSVAGDITSLNDYEAHLSGKVQFLLDAMVGLISIAQNDIFKVLTVVSIVGIPPTLIAGMYGMNFKNMPEYNWAWGYQWGLAVIVLSAVIPAVWFKIKGWF